MLVFPRILLDDYYEILKKIGQGVDGHVYLAKDIKDNKLVALKEFQMSGSSKLKRFEREINNLKKLSYGPCHANISCYRYSFQDSQTDKYYLVIDYYSGNTLASLTKKSNMTNLFYDLILNLLIDLLGALQFIHDRGIVHGDIKLENIVIIENNNMTSSQGITKIIQTLQPIIIDFGLSCNLNDTSCQIQAGSPLYMAPEIFQSYDDPLHYTGLSPKTDIWALGICFYAILIDADVWPSYIFTISDLKDYILSQEQQFHFDTPNTKLNNILNSMLVYNPSNRLTASQLLSL